MVENSRGRSGYVVSSRLVFVRPSKLPTRQDRRQDYTACPLHLDRSAVGGPSPRAWGQRIWLGGLRPARRSIPTGVGTTSTASRTRRSRTVHPHGRGDNSDWFKPYVAGYGPSPRAWGQRIVAVVILGIIRSIPTGVGTTSSVCRPPLCPAVHPHGRGDNLAGTAQNASGYGPSPRAWGQPDRGRVMIALGRSIPTGVGTTSGVSTKSGGPSVHPHGRGDNASDSNSAAKVIGPSPRAWGQQGTETGQLRLERSIPTGVGTTARCRSSAFCRTVHPHGRGDNAARSRHDDEIGGPSPRAWGQPSGNAASPLPFRSIPTGVGTTHAERTCWRPLLGPSPRAWGQH